MAGWVGKFLYPESDEAERKDKSNQVASSTTSVGGSIASLLSAVWSRADTPVDSSSLAESEPERDCHRTLEGQEPLLDKSWEDVDMAELKPVKAVSSQLAGEETSREHSCHSEISELKREVDDLKNVVQTQGKQIKEQQKGKWIPGLSRLRKQPSKDKGDECTQAIKEKETQIRDKDAQIRFYQRKLDEAEVLDEQSAQLAAQLSEKENKLEQVTKQLLHLQQEMKVTVNKNEHLKKRLEEAQTKHKDEIEKLTAKFQKQTPEPHVEVMLVSDGDLNRNLTSEEEDVAQLRSRIKTLEADLEKAVAHSKVQSHQILSLKQHVQGAEMQTQECMESSQGLLDDCNDRTTRLQQELTKVRQERSFLKTEHDRLTSELQKTHQALQSEERQRKLLDAQLDDDLTQCPKAKCIRIRKDYDTLANENGRLQQNIVDLSSIADEHRVQAQTINDLNKTIGDLNGQLTTANLQIESYKSDFVAERKDREAAHSKLADLERELAREKNRIDAERAEYQKRFGEFQLGSKERTASYAELKKQKDKLEKDVEKFNADSAKHKVETDKLKLEVQAKVSQVRQYKKENDSLKLQVKQATDCMLKLTEEVETIRKKAKRKSDDSQKRLPASALPDKSMAVEKRVAEMEKLCDRFQTEISELHSRNAQLSDDVATLTKVNRDLKELLKQYPYGGTAQHEEASSAVSPSQDEHAPLGDQLPDRPQSLPPLETEMQTVGGGEFHRGLPNQLGIPTDGQPRAKPTSAPLRARDPDLQPAKIVPLHAQRGNIVVVQPTSHGVSASRLGSPQQTPAQSHLQAPHYHPKSAHSADHTRTLSNQYGQTYVPIAATTPSTAPSGYGYDNGKHHSGSSGQSVPSKYSSKEARNQSHASPARDGPSTHKFADSPQPSTYPLHPGLYQPAATTSEPHQQTQTRSGDGSQYEPHSQPQTRQQQQPPQPMLQYEPSHESVAVRKQPEPRIQQRSQPGIPVYEPNLERAQRKARSDLQLQPKPDTDQPPLPHIASVNAGGDDRGDDDEENLRFQNRLQDQVDDDIHREASEVIQQVRGGQRHIMTIRQRPFDPNLVCPMCVKKFRIGEIQKFKHHVNTCDGTDDTVI